MTEQRNSLYDQEEVGLHSSDLGSNTFEDIDMDNDEHPCDLQYTSTLTTRRAPPQHTTSSFIPRDGRKRYQYTTTTPDGSDSYQSYREIRDSILARSPNSTVRSSSVQPEELKCDQLPVKQSPEEQSFAFQSIADFNNSAGPVRKVSSFSEGHSTTKSDSLHRRNTLADWFQGNSKQAGPTILSSLPEAEDRSLRRTSTAMSSRSQTRDSTRVSAIDQATSYFHKRMNTQTSFKQVAASAARLSWFGTKASEQPRKSLLPEPAEDEFLNLDIEDALFPSGPPSCVNQHGFDSLLANAENILRKMQTAYKERTFALHEVLAQKSAQGEELEEARTRAESSKDQLNDMAARVLEQEEAIKKLTEELKLEREARARDHARYSRQGRTTQSAALSPIIDSGDEPTPRRHVAKRSCSPTMTHDSGFESEEESYAESVFSSEAQELPAPPVSSVVSTPTSPDLDRAPASRLSAYGRVVKGLSPLANSLVGKDTSPSRCTNCHGVRAYEAWSVIGVLKDENKGLKGRVSELETVVDDCLGLVA